MSKIRLNGTTSGYTEIAPPAVAGDNTVTLPSSNGTANQFLKNGSTAGTLGWSSMIQDSDGNVGIGTSSPLYRLHLENTSIAEVGFNATGSGGGHWRLGTGSSISGIGGAFRFYDVTNAVERARITSGGYFKASNNGSYWNAGGPYHESNNTVANDPAHLFNLNNTSATNAVLFASCARSANNAYGFLVCYSGVTSDIEFRLQGDGHAYADQSWNGGGADYAEYFEWEDGNPDAEDRRGYPVALIGNKIKIAEDGDTIIGIVSAAPVVLGDAAWNHWSGKFLKDEFGSYIMEPHQVVEWTDADGKFHSYEDWNLPDGVIIPADATWKSVDENGKPFTHRKLNPDYDPTQPYVPRENRPEWSPIGLMGKLRLRKGQPVAANWLKLRDISATVEEWLVR